MCIVVTVLTSVVATQAHTQAVAWTLLPLFLCVVIPITTSCLLWLHLVTIDALISLLHTSLPLYSWFCRMDGFHGAWLYFRRARVGVHV